MKTVPKYPVYACEKLKGLVFNSISKKADKHLHYIDSPLAERVCTISQGILKYNYKQNDSRMKGKYDISLLIMNTYIGF